eukprot:317835_1
MALFIPASNDIGGWIGVVLLLMVLLILILMDVLNLHLAYSKFSNDGLAKSSNLPSCCNKRYSMAIMYLCIYGPPALCSFITPVITLLYLNNIKQFVSSYPIYFTVSVSMCCLHFVRRLLEGAFVHIFSNQKGVVFITIFLISYSYTLSMCSVGYSIATNNNFDDIENDNVMIYIGLMVFLIGSVGNIYCHYEMARLRKQKRKRNISSNDTYTGNSYLTLTEMGCLWETFICPHYCFEIIIWIGATITIRTLQILVTTFYVSYYLVVRIFRTNKWYHKQQSVNNIHIKESDNESENVLMNDSYK